MIEKCSVTGVETYTDDYGTKRLRSVQTDRGNVKSSTVVNCAGQYVGLVQHKLRIHAYTEKEHLLPLLFVE